MSVIVRITSGIFFRVPRFAGVLERLEDVCIGFTQGFELIRIGHVEIVIGIGERWPQRIGGFFAGHKGRHAGEDMP
ncbi:MAG TPA: hypothetical protein VE175_00495 [Woeseiaceae bacterium]|nr:hypothetical protein [Woeseiaceae bacterium]